LRKKNIIGRKDKGDFPEFHLEDISIKIDTGAYTSAIHCHKFRISEKDGKQILSFTLLDPSHEQYNNKEFSVDSFKEKLVKNSFGTSEKRYVIKTQMLLFDRLYPIELSLSERGEMRFPILIGRKFLMGKFLVNPSKYDLSFEKKQSRINNNNNETNDTETP
jgi:hypothetical protein